MEKVYYINSFFCFKGKRILSSGIFPCGYNDIPARKDMDVTKKYADLILWKKFII